ncbi:hypothetical protein RRG08_063288 [Elysia crispata]|uniref:WD repeat and coiled-coil-containing protein n=1 Tax=Elysia crispata TaxID=231223 RepID=A0AAE0XPC5_9GAST|nr:hypothetical protein RRG08_063288 [Elysia crispata]
MIAVHPQHGVIWTDGKAIYLAPIHVHGHQVQNATSVRLGQFEHVTSVHWSSPGTGVVTNSSSSSQSQSETESGPPPCHLCVVHQQNVTVWRVSGALPRLSFKQVRKINVRPVPQGCLWHPNNDVLCLLSRHQCSFYFRHDQNKGSYAFPSLESGKISCGCWSPDGKKLILCIGTALLIYKWEDVSHSISDFSASAWRIPGLEGQLTSISPVLKDLVVVATEIPLETLCKQDLFTVPDIHSNPSVDGIIRPNKSASPSQALMNLQKNEQASGTNSSSLVLVHLNNSGDPTKLSSVPLKGVVTPDILLYERNSQCVVVGSNTQSQIHIYALLEKHLAYCGDVQLEKGQRPKGLCSMSTAAEEKGSALLILVGQREVEDSALLSPTTEGDFRLSLKYIILKSGHDHRARNNKSGAHKIRSNLTSGNNSGVGDGAKKGPHPLVKSESMKEPGLSHKTFASVDQKGLRRERSGSVKNELGNYVRGPSGEVLSPISQTEEDSLLADSELLLSRPEIRTTEKRSKMIEELPGGTLPCADGDNMQTNTVKFSSQPPSFKNEKLASAYELRQPQHSNKFSDPRKDRQNGDSFRQENEAVQNREATSHKNGQISEVLSTKSEELAENQRIADRIQRRIQSEFVEDKTKSKSARFQETVTSHSSRPLNGQGEMPGSVKEISSGSYSTISTPDSGIALRSSTGSISPADADSHSPSPRYSSTSAGIWPEEYAPDSIGGRNEWEESLNSDTGLGGSHHSTDSGFASVERQVKTQKNSIESLQQRLKNLSVAVEESCCVFPTKYQELSRPELIQVVCERPGSANETKTFLLDNGRLKLEAVQLAFGLSIVELCLDDIPCVLSANVDGYIPIKFLPSTTVHITGISSKQTRINSSLV